MINYFKFIVEVKMIELIIGFLIGLFFKPIAKMVKSHLSDGDKCEHSEK